MRVWFTGPSMTCALALLALPGCEHTSEHDEATSAARAATHQSLSLSAVVAHDFKLVASDAANGDLFGGSVAASGNTVVVGANLDDHAGGADAGSAYVFVRSGSQWVFQAKLTASDAQAQDSFGTSVAIAGDRIVVGSPGDDDGGSVSGSAYVFARTGTSWSQQAKLTASDAAAGDLLGHSVAIAGDTVVLGAPGDDSFRGSAYVFDGSGSAWVQQAKLLPAARGVGDRFGESVAVSGDDAVVGAHLHSANDVSSGAAYVFRRQTGSWSEQTKLLPSDAAAADRFGTSVSLSGDTVLVGAPRDDHAGGVDAGSAYVFVRQGSTWSEQAKLLSEAPEAGDQLGISVALVGDRALVGAHWSSAAITYGGAAELFVRSGTSWAQVSTLVAGDAGSNDKLGAAVALGSTAAVLGAPERDSGLGGVGTNAGAAYAFDLGSQGAGGGGEGGAGGGGSGMGGAGTGGAGGGEGGAGVGGAGVGGAGVGGAGVGGSGMGGAGTGGAGGSGIGGAGADDDESDEGCSCASVGVGGAAAPAGPGAMMLVLGSLWLRRRRRTVS